MRFAVGASGFGALLAMTLGFTLGNATVASVGVVCAVLLLPRFDPTRLRPRGFRRALIELEPEIGTRRVRVIVPSLGATPAT